MAANKIFEFDRFRLDADHAMLYREGRALPIPPKAVETLLALIEGRGEIISKNDLMDRIWSDSIVEESNLAQYLHILRKALGDGDGKKPFIETLRKRGYRFSADVKIIEVDLANQETQRIFGRDAEIDHLTDLVTRRGERLLALLGVGGVGKTTLARALSKRLQKEFADGVFFVELASIERPEHIAPAIASSLGLRIGGDSSPFESVASYIGERRLILFLDNFEHVIAGAQQVADLYAAGPNVSLVVTSRVQLRLSMAYEYAVAPLAVPVRGGGPEDSETTESPAVELFVARANKAKSSFKLTDQNAVDVSAICRRVDGIPLAIELAAAKTAFMSPSAILSRLESQLKLLTGGPRDVPFRQQAMRGTIAWSYDLLEEKERTLFSEISVFAGSFSLEAAEEVCGERAGRDRFFAVEGITSLVGQNLLAMKEQADGEARYQMLEVVAEFAAEMLGEFGTTEAAERRHAEFYLSLAERAEPQLQAAHSAEWLRKLEIEHDNIRAALTRSLRLDASLGQRLAGAIWKFWWLHGHISEGCIQLDAFLAQDGSLPETRAKMLAGATFLNRLKGNSDLSRMYAEEAAELARVSGDNRHGALAFNQLGFLALDVRDFAQAGAFYEQGLELAKELGDKQILGLLYNGLGELSRTEDKLEDAAGFYSLALGYNREAGDRVRQTTNLINLGATALLRNDPESAGKSYREGLEIASKMEDMNGTLYCLEGFAGTYWAEKDPEVAARLYGAADELRKASDLLLESADRLPYETSLDRVRRALADSMFKKLFEDGRDLTLAKAVELALSGG